MRTRLTTKLTCMHRTSLPRYGRLVRKLAWFLDGCAIVWARDNIDRLLNPQEREEASRRLAKTMPRKSEGFGMHAAPIAIVAAMRVGRACSLALTCPAMPILPASSVPMAILKPMPSSPSKLALGTRHPSMMRLAVEDALMPSLSSFFPRDIPGLSNGTMKALIPLKIKHGSRA